jgi:hypothetical protein
VRRAELPVIALIGTLITAGDSLHATASTERLVRVVAVFSELYAVVTIAPAWVLHERLELRRQIGITTSISDVVALPPLGERSVQDKPEAHPERTPRGAVHATVAMSLDVRATANRDVTHSYREGRPASVSIEDDRTLACFGDCGRLAGAARNAPFGV